MTVGPRGFTRAVAGIVVSVVAIVILVRSVDLPAAVTALGRAQPVWLLVAVAFVAFDTATRALRWRSLLVPLRSIPYRRVLRYTLIGYLANNVLPARLGEVVRSHYAGDREAMSRSAVLGTVLVERTVDTLSVVAIAGVMVLILHVGGPVEAAVVVGALLAVVLLIAVVVAIAAHRLPGGAALLARLERWPRLAGVVRRLRAGLEVAARPTTALAAVALSLVAWALTTGAFMAAGRAVGIPLDPAAGALVGCGAALATAVPAGPGYLGTFELATVGILGALGFSGDAALAAALVAHVAILGTTTIGGAIAMAQLGW